MSLLQEIFGYTLQMNDSTYLQKLQYLMLSMMKKQGFEKNRFVKLENDVFDCLICHCIAQSPKECSECGFIFCQHCISSWYKRKKICPNKCKGKIQSISSKALLKIYKNLQIKCQNYEHCQAVVKLMDLQKHKTTCDKTIDIFKSQQRQGSRQSTTEIIRNKSNKLTWKTINESKTIIENSDQFTLISNFYYQPAIVTTSDPLMPKIYYWQIVTRKHFDRQIQIGLNIGNKLYYKTDLWKNKQINKGSYIFGLYINTIKGTVIFTQNNKKIESRSQMLNEYKNVPIYPIVFLESSTYCKIYEQNCPTFLIDQ